MNLLYTLTSGRLGYVSMVLASILLVTMRIILPMKNSDDTGLAICIFICLIPFYIKLSLRMVIVMHSSHVNLTPNYFLKLKQALFTLVGLSFIPSLLLLPDINALAVLWAWQLLAILIITIGYKYKIVLWLFLAVLIINPMIAPLLKWFNIDLPEQFILYLLSDVMVYGLSIWIGLFVWIVLGLEKHTLSASRIVAIKGAYQGDIFSFQKVNQLNANVDLRSYWSKHKMSLQLPKNIATKLAVFQPLSQTQLIAIATNAINRIDLRYIISTLAVFAILFVVIVLLGANNTPTTYTLLLLGSGGGLAFSMFSFAASFNNNKHYLARMRLTPLFKNDKEFNYALMRCCLLRQLESAILFIVLIVSYLQLFTMVNDSFYLQIISTNILAFCSLMSLFTWGLRIGKVSRFNQLWGPIIIGFIFGTYNMLAYLGHQPLSMQIKSIIAAIILSITAVSLLVWRKKGINWRIA